MLKYLNALALAIWYMDDGAKERCIIATDGFSDKDRIQLSKFLQERFDLNIILRKSGKIAFSKKDTRAFFKVISRYKISSMAYKFPNPLTTNPD